MTTPELCFPCCLPLASTQICPTACSALQERYPELVTMVLYCPHCGLVITSLNSQKSTQTSFPWKAVTLSAKYVEWLQGNFGWNNHYWMECALMDEQPNLWKTKHPEQYEPHSTSPHSFPFTRKIASNVCPMYSPPVCSQSCVPWATPAHCGPSSRYTLRWTLRMVP